MICSTPVHLVCNYAASSQYCKAPDPELIEKGVIPLDSLPADWWNWMWADTNKAVNEARAGFTALINELESVLDGAGIVADCNCVNQVYRAIDKIRQTLATAATAGAVKSSSANGNVTVNEDGTMTANGLGNVTNITFGNVGSVVSGLNCLYTYTNDCFTSINGSISSLGNSKAPVMHADTTVIYGVGNASCYGHVKLSDTYNTALEDQSGVAASQKAINDMYNQFANGMAPLSNTPAKDNGDTASAGSSTCAARADHVHKGMFPGLACNYLCMFICPSAQATNTNINAVVKNNSAYAVLWPHKSYSQNPYMCTNPSLISTLCSSPTDCVYCICHIGIICRCYGSCLCSCFGNCIVWVIPRS